MHSAGATLSVVAALLRASERQMIAQEIQQGGPRIDRDGVRLPIDHQCEADAFRFTVCRVVGLLLIHDLDSPHCAPEKHARPASSPVLMSPVVIVILYRVVAAVDARESARIGSITGCFSERHPSM